MKEYKIKPLNTGYFHMDWGFVCAPLLQGYVADLPVFMFLIEAPDGEQIIVDSGFNPETTAGKFIFNPVPRTPDLEVSTVLERNGVDPDRIDTVIITHLHHDHTGNLKLFRNARFIVQETELLESTYPVNTQVVGVAHEDWIELIPQFKLVNGDFHLQDGIDLVLAPGHTAGHQAVMVNTSRGKAMIMGDASYMYGGLAKRFPKQFADLVEKSMSVATAPIDFTSPEVQKEVEKIFSARFGGYFGPSILNPGENMQSMHKLDLMADIIIPGHDRLLLDMKVIPDDYTLFDEEVRQ